MKIIASEDRFALVNATDADLLVAKEKCGFRFDPVTAMFIGNAANVDMLKNHRLLLRDPLTITEAAAAMYRAAGKKILSAIEMSHAKESDVIVPCPSGLDLYPFQKAGVAYALQRTNTLISDEMGCGKSPMSVGVSNCLPDVRKVLIICPASLKINWSREWNRFDVKNLSVGIAGKTWPNADVCIINYDLLKKYRDQLRAHEYDLMVLDEAHYLKSGKADRTKEVFGGVKRDGGKKIIERITPIEAKRKLFLTGTPMLNGKPKELWNLIRAIDPDGLGADWFAFARRYCELVEIERWNPAKSKKEHVGWKWDGASHLDELQAILRQKFMVRRLKKDVLAELPPKTRQIIVLETKKGLTKLLEQEKLSYEEYVKKHGEAAVPLPAFTEYAKSRKEVAIAKIPYVIEYLKEVLDEAEKAVVWTHHHEVTDAIFKSFEAESVVVDGRVSSEDRQHRVDRFQTDGSCKLFIGGIHSAGTGLTLTASSVCVFAEIDWTPAVLTQCEDRQHRIGQKENVLVRHVVLNGSIDQRIVQTLIRKQEIADLVLDAPK